MFRALVEGRLRAADIVPDRGKPWDPFVHHPRFWRRVALGGSLGLGGSYMDSDWDVQELDTFIKYLVVAGLDQKITGVPGFMRRISRSLGAATSGRFWQVAAHYDVGDDLFAAMLGSVMCYTCADWTKAKTLAEAQLAKIDSILARLNLRPGMTMLDIGCGFGDLMAHAAYRYGVECTGITISERQAALAGQRCAGLPVTIKVQGYEKPLGQRFDRVVSVGMFEHVGLEAHRGFMRAFAGNLKPNGLGLLHTIGRHVPGDPDPWIRKYVFGRGYIPTDSQLRNATEGILETRHRHVLGSDNYDKTLVAWWQNLENAWLDLRPRYGSRLGGRFHQMWKFYLLGCAGVFRAKALDVWQMVMVHPGQHPNYRPQ